MPRQKRNLAKVRPLAMVTDGLRAYQHAIPKEVCTMKTPRTEHIRIPNIRTDQTTNN